METYTTFGNYLLRIELVNLVLRGTSHNKLGMLTGFTSPCLVTRHVRLVPCTSTRSGLTLTWRRVYAHAAPGTDASKKTRTDDTETKASPPSQVPILPTSSNIALASSSLVFVLGAALPAMLAQLEGAPLSSYGSHYTMLGLLLSFGTLHSGLASLRPNAVSLMGERLYRVLFAFASLPTATLTISYFIAHRYDGAMLWTLRSVPGAHTLVWLGTFVSFLLLYPATFDLAQVAAIKRPRITLFEGGVTRITRHPQLWGQVLWCFTHSAWLGSSFSVVASAGLIAHHLFGVWNGDRRLRDAYGDEWAAYAKRTSIVPFAAIASGDQKLALDEFPIIAYLGTVLFVLGAYKAHPIMMSAVHALHL